jgi:HK97 gp10 family phage protein
MIAATFNNNFREALQKLSDSIGENALRAAGYAGAAVLQAEMIARVPVKTGVIEKNIIVKRATEKCDTNKKQVFLATVRTGTTNTEGDAFYWRWVEDGHKFVRRRKGKGAGVVINRKTGKETMKAARMASELEYGSVKRGANPFMRPAWEAQKAAALEAVRDRLAQKIAEALGTMG